jgi:hypothetical protein
MSFYICEAEATALVLVEQFLMVYASQVQQGGLEIMHMHRVFYNIITKLISFSIGNARFDACSGHPHGKAAWVMVAPEVVFGKLAL